MNSVKERPILFSTPMVRAILEGHKTQTRRVADLADNVCVCDGVAKGFLPGAPDGFVIPCRYGHVGDRLWVRETFLTVGGTDPEKARVVYRASNDGPDAWVSPVWRPSIFMPRWASRLTLEITKVRVERLQEITAHDSFAEGVEVPCLDEELSRETLNQLAVAGYKHLWDSINLKRGLGWEKNPWVWVVEFRKVTA